MIYQLELENFYAIRERQVIDLRVAAKVPPEPHRFGPIYTGSPERVPKVVAVFGANGSGKTTVLRALAFLVWFIRDSFHLKPEAPLPLEPFRSAESQAQVTRLAVSLGGPTNLEGLNGSATTHGIYRYELQIAHRLGRSSAVISESLTHRLHGGRKPYRIFLRTGDGKVVPGKSFSLTKYGSVVDKIRSNASVISTLAQFGHAPALALRDAAQSVTTNILIFKQEYTDAQVLEIYAGRPQLLEALNREIPRIDTGARQMHVLARPQGPLLEFDHEGLSYPVPWLLESHGTQSFVRSFPLLWQPLANGGVAVIDELDASLHPLLLPEIARWFYDPRRNPSNAQLWLTCQNASFLEELAKEEVLFCEKDNFGRSRVYGLQDIKYVRRVDNFYRKYLSGTYGAVPNIG
ncbi:MAG TPA: AAA family ATPase [Alphaproteobacteria bacterium]